MLDINQIALMCVELEKEFDSRNQLDESIERAYTALFSLGCTESSCEHFYKLCNGIKLQKAIKRTMSFCDKHGRTFFYECPHCRDESLPVQHSRGRSKLFKE